MIYMDYHRVGSSRDGTDTPIYAVQYKNLHKSVHVIFLSFLDIKFLILGLFSIWQVSESIAQVQTRDVN